MEEVDVSSLKEVVFVVIASLGVVFGHEERFLHFRAQFQKIGLFRDNEVLESFGGEFVEDGFLFLFISDGKEVSPQILAEEELEDDSIDLGEAEGEEVVKEVLLDVVDEVGNDLVLAVHGLNRSLDFSGEGVDSVVHRLQNGGEDQVNSLV